MTSGPPSGWHPDWVVPPGETLDEELKERDISQASLARAIGMSTKHLNQIVKGHAKITPAIALSFEEALGGPSAEFWCGLQAQHDLAVLRRNTESPKKKSKMPKVKDKTVIELPVVLGNRYKDTISGWEGVATACIVYMNGCIRVESSGQDKDGKPVGYMFDQEQLIPVEAPPVERKAPSLTGGDRGLDPPLR